ncbi:MAG: hypothetical protein DRJ52_09025 [Thermoprotei archaeon]|nr:MAG: hypothetical protein DRJ52_09025 [Thermoprotei archaeon]RLE98204.1 MAG: hypothetical protein DRJ63_08055 [Thermoprotei archaeon]
MELVSRRNIAVLLLCRGVSFTIFSLILSFPAITFSRIRDISADIYSARVVGAKNVQNSLRKLLNASRVSSLKYRYFDVLRAIVFSYPLLYGKDSLIAKIVSFIICPPAYYSLRLSILEHLDRGLIQRIVFYTSALRFIRRAMGEEGDSSSPLEILKSSKEIRALLVRALLVSAAGGVTGGLGVIYFKHVLGATPIILGFLSSVSSLTVLVSMFFSGWLSDNYGRKRAFVLGTLLAAIPPLLFFLADNWVILIPGFIISAVGSSFISPSYQYIIRVCTKRANRSTSIAIISTASNIVAMIVPPLAAFTIMYLGGIRLVRYSFFIGFILISASALYIAKSLKIPEYREKSRKRTSVFEPFRDLVKVYRISKERKLHYWLFFVTLGPMATTVVGPFWSLYAYEVCETPGELIGLLPTAQSLTYILLLIPISKLSDKIGRKKVYLSLRPFFWLSFLTLVLAGTFRSEYSYLAPFLSWAFYGIYATSSPSMAASLIESFPKEYVSRWTSLRNILYYIVAIFAGYLGGVLWSIDPRLPFTVAFISDTVRTLLLFKVPETHISVQEEASEKPPRHIVIYELPGAGLGTVAKLLRNRLRLQVIDDGSEELLREAMRRDEPSLIEGEAGLKLAKERNDALVVLLVAPRYNRALKVMKKKREPLFVVYKELEDEDKKVSKTVKKYFNADLEHLPPFDIAINTQKIPLEVAEKIIEVAYTESRKKKSMKESKS